MYYRLDLLVICPICGKALPYDEEGRYPCENCNIELDDDYEIIEGEE